MSKQYVIDHDLVQAVVSCIAAATHGSIPYIEVNNLINKFTTLPEVPQEQPNVLKESDLE